LEADDRDGPQDRRKPPVQLDEEQAIGIRKLNATSYLTPQLGHLMPEPAFSAASRLFDLNGEAGKVSKKHSSASMAR
jgi:hypothetical protein